MQGTSVGEHKQQELSKGTGATSGSNSVVENIQPQTVFSVIAPSASQLKRTTSSASSGGGLAWRWFKNPTISSALATVAAKIGSSTAGPSSKVNQNDEKIREDGESDRDGEKASGVNQERHKDNECRDKARDSRNFSVNIAIPDLSLPAVVRDHSSPVERYGQNEVSDLFIQEEDDTKAVSSKLGQFRRSENGPCHSEVKKTVTGLPRVEPEVSERDCMGLGDISYSETAILNENYTNSIKSDDIDWEEVKKYEERLRKIDEPIKIADNSKVFSLPNVEVIRCAEMASRQCDMGDNQDSDIKTEQKDDITNGNLGPAETMTMHTASDASDVAKSKEIVEPERRDSSSGPVESKIVAEQTKQAHVDGAINTDNSDDVEANAAQQKALPQVTPQANKKSPRSGFSLLSFFDRILLPHDKSKIAADKSPTDSEEASKGGSASIVTVNETNSTAVDAQKLSNTPKSDSSAGHKPDTKSKTSPVSPTAAAGTSDQNTRDTDTPHSRIRSIFFKSKAQNPDTEKIIQEEKEINCKIITTAGAVRNKSAENFPKSRPLSAFVDREIDSSDDMDYHLNSRPRSLYDVPYGDLFLERDNEDSNSFMRSEPEKCSAVTSNCPSTCCPETKLELPKTAESKLDKGSTSEELIAELAADVVPTSVVGVSDQPLRPGTLPAAAAVRVARSPKLDELCSEASLSESDSSSSERRKVAGQLNVTQSCQWTGQTDDDIIVPEYRYEISSEITG